MAKFIWKKEEVPNDLPVKQVYGIAFSPSGNVILRVEDNKYKLTGGKPEARDKNFIDTLKREYLEELNVELEDIYYLGYLLVEENEEEYAQIRMIAKIKRIGNKKADTDNGKTYDRFMVSPQNMKKYLNYQDEAGMQMIDEAIELAQKKYNLDFNNEEFFI